MSLKLELGGLDGGVRAGLSDELGGGGGGLAPGVLGAAGEPVAVRAGRRGAVERTHDVGVNRKSTRLNSSHVSESRMPSSA